MLLVGLENCGPCKILHEKYPHIPFVEVPRHAGAADMDVFEVKKAISRLGVKEFPVLLNDAMNEILPLSLIDPKLK